jgi:diguanylate cyclase (GGDEF)-like protein
MIALAVVALVVLAAVVAERYRAASRLRRSEVTASALAAERTALGLIGTAIARERPTEHILRLVARHAAVLLAASTASVERDIGEERVTIAKWIEDGVRPGPEQISVPIKVAQTTWGRLVVNGMREGEPLGGREGEPPGSREQLLHRLADLAGLALSSAEAHARLNSAATTDTMTGLHNQRAFRQRLVAEIVRSERYDRPLTLILLDLDDFKAVNETEGHLAGDVVLTEVARRLKATIRLDALAARLDGDEFAVLVPECDTEGGYQAAERIRAAVAASPVSPESQVTLSAGVATLEPADLKEDVIQAAEAALYAAKRLGGDSSVLYTPGLENQRGLTRHRPAQTGAA